MEGRGVAPNVWAFRGFLQHRHTPALRGIVQETYAAPSPSGYQPESLVSKWRYPKARLMRWRCPPSMCRSTYLEGCDSYLSSSRPSRPIGCRFTSVKEQGRDHLAQRSECFGARVAVSSQGLMATKRPEEMGHARLVPHSGRGTPLVTRRGDWPRHALLIVRESCAKPDFAGRSLWG